MIFLFNNYVIYIYMEFLFLILPLHSVQNILNIQFYFNSCSCILCNPMAEIIFIFSFVF
jgi:hypothetical protein